MSKSEHEQVREALMACYAESRERYYDRKGGGHEAMGFKHLAQDITPEGAVKLRALLK